MPWGDVQVLNLSPLSSNPCPLSPRITRCFPFARKAHAHSIKWRTHIWAQATPAASQNTLSNMGFPVNNADAGLPWCSSGSESTFHCTGGLCSILGQGTKIPHVPQATRELTCVCVCVCVCVYVCACSVTQSCLTLPPYGL